MWPASRTGSDVICARAAALVLCAAGLFCTAHAESSYSEADFLRVPKFDAHVHANTDDHGFLNMARRDGFELLSINVDYPDFPPLREQARIAHALQEVDPAHFHFATTFSMAGFGTHRWTVKTNEAIEAEFKRGAVAVKIWKNVGMVEKDAHGKLFMIDDPGFDGVMAHIQKLGLPLIAHQGEPKDCWLPMAEMITEDDRSYFRDHPDYYMYLHPEMPRYEELMAARDRFVARHPRLSFVGAHMASLEWSVDALAKFLDAYPNATVDLAARMSQMQYQSTQERGKVRRFFIEYQDRLLYGTDLTDDPAEAAGHAQNPPVGQRQFPQEADATWRSDWKYLATNAAQHIDTLAADVAGLELPKSVIDKIYYANAQRVFEHLRPAVSATNTAWITAWTAAPDSAGPAFAAQTVRQIVRASIGGSTVRIRLSNLFGTGAVTIGPVHLAVHAAGSSIRPGTDHVVTFAHAPAVTIEKGADVLSDPVALSVTALQELAVSLYLPSGIGTASTVHALGGQTAYITATGEHTADATLPNNEVSASRFFLTDVEVSAAAGAASIVAFGDSITDGDAATQDANSRWPDVLAARLQGDPSLADVAVVNSGISGNRILHDGTGPAALARFDRDALNKPGVRLIVLLEGINDIGNLPPPDAREANINADRIIDGMKTLISRAHARGIKIWGATLTPFGGVDWPYHSAGGEQMRAQINAWIRDARAFDAVVDFDLATHDTAAPDRFLAAYDSGDHLHPRDAGYKAMAAAIDLGLVRRDVHPGR